MFFLLSKIIGFITLPSNAIALLCGAGLLGLLVGWQRSGLSLMGTGIVLLLVFGFSPVGNILLLTLTERFPAWQAEGEKPAGIIVLGGSIDPEVSEERDDIEVGASAERIIAMLRLAKQFPEAKIVFSGGNGSLLAGRVKEAFFAGRLLEEFGIDPRRVLLEAASRTTAENARLTRTLVAPEEGERWLLVTSAFHMPRAVGAFRKAGFEVEAYPVDWRTQGWRDALMPFHRLSAGLARSDVACHEWVGLISYWLTGRTPSLLPGPRPQPQAVKEKS